MNWPSYLAMPLMKSDADAGAEGGRRFDVVGGQVDDLVDGVDHDAHVLAAVVAVVGVAGGLDDDDAGAAGDLGGAAAEPGGHVDDRDDAAAQVDHAADEGRHHRDDGEAAELHDLGDVEDRQGEDLTAEHERQVAVRPAARRRVLVRGSARAVPCTPPVRRAGRAARVSVIVRPLRTGRTWRRRRRPRPRPA